MTKSRGIKIKRGVAHAYFLEHRYEEVEGCKLWPFNTDKDGYGMVWIDGTGKYKRLGVIACEDRWGPMPEPGMVAAHGACHNPLCWSQDHVTWKTHKQNAVDRYRDETALIGEKNPNAHLTSQQVLEIRKLAAEGCDFKDLSSKFGIGRDHVWKIVTRRAWRHL